MDLKNTFEMNLLNNINEFPEEFKLSDGRTLYIQNNNYNFFHLVKELPKKDIFKIFDFKLSDLITIKNDLRKEQSEVLLNIFSSKWKWKETGDTYSFKDACNNYDLFGVKLTKNKIIRRIKSNTILLEELDKISSFFNSQKDLYN